MLSRRVLIGTVIIIALLLGALVGSQLIRKRPQSPRPASVTATPSATPFAAEQLIEGYTRDFVERYYTYQSSRHPSYLASIKPFLEESLFLKVSEENAKLDAKGVRSELESLRVRPSDDGAIAEIAISSFESGAAESYQKEAAIYWARQDGRWVIVRIQTLKNTKRDPYLES